MKKILLGLILAPMAIAFEVSAATLPPKTTNQVETNNTVELAQWYGPHRRIRRCSYYRYDCARIRTPIGSVLVGRCYRVCHRWGWGWARLTDIANANTTYSAKTMDIANKYDLPVDMADAIVGQVEETKVMPSSDVINRMAQTYDVDANVVTKMAEEAAAQ